MVSRDPGAGVEPRPATRLQPHPIESPRDLRPLLDGAAFHRVSLYVPFERAPTQLPASRLRLRAAADRASERLRERGVAGEEIAARMDRLKEAEPPLRSFDPAARTLVWLGDAQGWALANLPEPCDERVVVAEHYALRPLLRALQRAHRFRVLAISANRVAAYAGDEAGLHRIELPGVPASIEEALGAELEGGELSFRSEQPVPGRRSPGQIYHGHGGGADERALDRERYHRVLGAAIASAWRDDDLPVVLAAEVRTASELRKHLDLPTLLDGELRGNPDRASAEELHAGTWPIVRAAFEERTRELADRFEAVRNAGKATEREFDAVCRQAIAGAIRRLWVEEQARVPGRVDEMRACRVDATDADEDALDALVALTLRRAGEVRVVGPGETPTGGAFCAELR